jgi:glucose/arabinose dehydrogenase
VGAVLLAALVALVALPGSASATSLRFFGNGEGGIDRVKIRIDPATPADVGATDFTLEWWMRALPGENASGDVACDANDGWILGNIIFDRDIFGNGEHGDFGVSLTDGRIAFGVSADGAGNTICGATDVADGVWHHVAVTRRKSDGWLRIYVDGVLDAEGAGNVGANKDVSYLNGRSTDHDNDPFLVIGAEKHDAGPEYPSYRGWIDEVRLSTVQRYTKTRFTRPFGAFTTDASTAALYHLDEGAGESVGDASGGGSHGAREYGGSPAGPEWSSQAAPLDSAPRVALEQVIAGLSRPVAIANAGDGRLFVVEADGRILAYQATEDGPFELLGTFLDIRDRVKCCGEQGLLGLAFHPSYAANRYFFVYYTAKTGNGDVVIARFRAPAPDSNGADANTEAILLTLDHSAHSNHNGGGLAFGPDGYLYASVGDGGGAGDPLGSGQNLGTLLGKVLRLDVDVPGDPTPHYEIPPDNPFVDTVGAREEIWAWGLRNPWRIGFDRVTGDLFIADVGQGSREEINFQLAADAGGENYGWSRMEGKACFSPGSSCQTGSLVLPVLDYSHSDGCSVTGGYRYRGAAIPALHGAYVFGDFCSKKVWLGVQAGSGTWSRADLLTTELSISTFGEDAAGELYVAHLGGSIHRLVRVRPRLTVTRTGGGAGTVDGPGGLACGAVCSVEYEPGTTVTLTAAAAASSFFAGWSGACGGTEDCVVVMDGDRSVTATIAPRAILQFSAPAFTATEGSGSATITVQRLATTAGPMTVDYAIVAGTATASPAAGADFTGPGGLLTGTLTFSPGQASKTFTIPIVDDTRAEPGETVLLSLHNPTAGAVLGDQPTAVLTILSPDASGALRFGKAQYALSEGNAGTQLIVLRSSGTANAAVQWTIVPEGTTAVLGTDYTTPGGGLAGTLTFAAGVKSVPLPVTVAPLRRADTLVNPPLTIRFALSDPEPAGFATVGVPATATVTITDDDTGGTLQFSPASVSVSEAAVSGTAVLTVARAHKAGGVSVNWAVVAGGTAVLNTDYGGPTTGTLNFGADVLSQAIELPILNPAGAQGSRTVLVELSAPTGGATLGAQKQATLTITDDEIGLQFSKPAYSASEKSASAVITVVRTGPGNAPVKVDFATTSPGGEQAAVAAAPPSGCTPGADYRPVSGTLSFAVNDMSKSFTVPLCRDGVVEPAPKVIGLALSSPQPGGVAHLGPRSAADLTINNMDAGGVLRWSSAAYSASETAGQVAVTVARSGGSAGNVTVDYVIAGVSATAPPAAGADFTGPAPGGSLTGTLDFAAGVMTRTLMVPLVNDTAIESNETVRVTLQNAQNGAIVGSPSLATITITDDDRAGTVRFSRATTTTQEHAGSVTLTVVRTGPTSAAAAVHYKITGDTDQVSGPLTGTVTFAPGASSRPLSIPLVDDSSPDGNATLAVTLEPPLTGGLALGGPNPATVNLVDDEGTVQFLGPTFTISESSTSAAITLTRTGGTARPVTVAYAAGAAGDSATAAPTPGGCAAGADYRPIAGGSLTFNPGETSKTLVVSLCGDSAEEGAEALTLRLTGVTLPAQLGVQSTAVLQILENDEGGVLRFSSAGYSVPEGAATGILTVLRSDGAADDITLPWSITGGTALLGTDYDGPTSGTLDFSASQSSAGIEIPVLNDAIVDGPRTVVVTLGAPAGGATLGNPSVGTLTINDNEPAVRFSSGVYAVSEGSHSATVTVRRQGSPGTEVHVTVQTTGSGNADGGDACAEGLDYRAVSLPLTFLPGQTTRSVSIPLCPDTTVDGSETIGLALASPTGATLGNPHTATIQVSDDDVGGTAQFAAAAVSASEAQGIAHVVVKRTGGSAGDITVHWTITGGTADHGDDYTGPTGGTLAFGPGEMNRALDIALVDRPGSQGPRTITLHLDGAEGGGALGAQTATTLWILDD